MMKEYDRGFDRRDDLFDFGLSDEEFCDFMNWLETECEEEQEEENE